MSKERSHPRQRQQICARPWLRQCQQKGSLPFLITLILLLLSTTTTTVKADDSNLIVVDGFVDTTTCYQNLVEADANADGMLQSNEFVEFTQLQSPPGTLDEINTYRNLPLVMQATFVTLTCLCRDERFGGDPTDTTCCLGVNANIAIAGHTQGSTSQERTRLFATCFLTDQAIVQVLGSESPSAAPTEAPTISPTALPSAAPTMTPTVQTAAPTTLAPTVTPTTDAPSNSPTDSPTVQTAAPTTLAPTTFMPSALPTVTPTTDAPSNSPTDSPTTAPVVGPTTAPVPEPTAVPTITPTAVPTVIPTSAPTTTTAAPTQIFTSTASVMYTIAVVNGESEGIPQRAYRNDLVESMNQLATVIVAQTFGVRLRRRLVVSLQLPTSIETPQVTECWVGLTTENDRCEDVTAFITLEDSQQLDPNAVADFESAVLNAIERGDLQLLLPSDSPVRILTGLDPATGTAAPITRGTDGDEGLSNGAVSGIVVAALVVALLPIALYVGMRRNHEEKEPYGAYEPHDEADADEIGPEEDVEAKHISKSSAAAAAGGGGTLGAKPTNYGKKEKSSEPMEHMHKVAPVSPDSRGDDDDDERSHASSSNAGSSGWSSSAGLSSLNTGSAEDSMDMLHSPQGSSLAAIAAASASSRKTERSANLSPRAGTEAVDIPPGSVSRTDLDNAIEAGDWAAVGATAALLAAASDSQSQSSRSRTSRSQNTSGSSIDAARAAELDHLVDAGDWEGVVLAAAKFESQEGGGGSSSIRSGTASSARSSSAGSETRSGTGSGTYTPSVSTSVSESASKAQKRQEIRQEVEALVRKVVPEEIDNVDEMMLQFKGREEELVETLRTMQERAIAQKARTAGHKAAKQEARRTVQRGQVPVASPPEETPATPNRDGQSSSAGGTSDGTDKSAQRKRTALEQAIEAGDWEAVGEAAALMSDTSMSVGSVSTEEIDRLAAAGSRGVSAGSVGSATSPRTGGVNAERAKALDELIDRGDWSAVVEAAGKFSQADKEAASDASSADSPAKRPAGTPVSESADSSKRAKQLKEEEDALAQAEMWMQIAEQTKAEGGTASGASDAADWAISQSLKKMSKAEGRDSGSNSDGSQGSKEEGGEDDGSV